MVFGERHAVFGVVAVVEIEVVVEAMAVGRYGSVKKTLKTINFYFFLPITSKN